jgi:tetratricopeptide (TPR) repeat protein
MQPNGAGRPREEAGIIETATLSPAERSRRTAAHLREQIQSHPDVPSLRLDLGTLLLTNAEIEEGIAAFRDLLGRNPPGEVAYKAGDILLSFDQYALARDFLARSVDTIPAARLDLGLAVFSLEGPNRALGILEQIPERDRSGDYFLLQAQIEDSAGRIVEAGHALARSMELSLSRPRLARAAALLLLRRRQPEQALEILSRSLRSHPDDPDLLLTKAVVLTSLDHSAEALQLLRTLESRWPEWEPPYVAEALILERESRMSEARRRLEIASGLNGGDPVLRCALDVTKGTAAPSSDCACQPGVFETFFPPCH